MEDENNPVSLDSEPTSGVKTDDLVSLPLLEPKW